VHAVIAAELAALAATPLSIVLRNIVYLLDFSPDHKTHFG
jgi:hypothetical protein